MSNHLIDLLLILFLPVISIIVFGVHELGHYIAARAYKVHIVSFTIGYGKKIVTILDSRGTSWVFRLFPVGGHIKMFGHVFSSSNTDNDQVRVKKGLKPFREQNIFNRFIIVLAGPVSNFLLSIILLFSIYFFIGLPGLPPHVTGVSSESVSAKAGFKPDDIILKYNNKNVVRFEDLIRAAYGSAEKEIEFKIQRSDSQIELTVTPELVEFMDTSGNIKKQPRLGIMGRQAPLDLDAVIAIDDIEIDDNVDVARNMIIDRLDSEFKVTLKNITSKNYHYIIHPKKEFNKGLFSQDSRDYNFIYLGSQTQSSFINVNFSRALNESLYSTYYISQSLVNFAFDCITGNLLDPDWSILVPEASFPHSNMYLFYFVFFIYAAAILSMIIGLINLVPVAWTDGGYLLLFLFEKFVGLEKAKTIKPYLSRIGVALLLAFTLFGNLNDITELIQ